MPRADTPEEFGVYLRWTHVPLFAAIVSLVIFVRIVLWNRAPLACLEHLRLRLVILVVNFLVWPNVNYSVISALQRHAVLGGEQIAIADGVIRPWTRLMQLASVLFFVFVVDAAIQLWRRGDFVQRRRAWWWAGHWRSSCWRRRARPHSCSSGFFRCRT